MIEARQFEADQISRAYDRRSWIYSKAVAPLEFKNHLQAIDKAVENKKEKTVPFEYPWKCPAGHKHLSWGPGEERVYCWDCSRYYPVKAFVRPHETSLSESQD